MTQWNVQKVLDDIEKLYTNEYEEIAIPRIIEYIDKVRKDLNGEK